MNRTGFNQVVVDRGVHDRSYQPVRLGDRPRVSVLQAFGVVVPVTYRDLGDVAQRHLPEGRHQLRWGVVSFAAVVEARCGTPLAVRRLAIHFLA